MKYIKINNSNFQQIPKNHTYLIELDDDGNTTGKNIILNIDKNVQLRNKSVHGNKFGTLLQWLKNYKFRKSEIEKHEISQEEFNKKWDEITLAGRKN